MVSIPGYKIIGELGSGASATVYRAIQEGLAREVALKVMSPGLFVGDEFQARFLREAKIQASLIHPNLLQLFDAGVSGDTLYLAMELVGGGSLREFLDRHGALSLPKAIELCTGVAEGLACAHARSIVHRDLKPENVLLSDEGQVKVADFGLAKPESGGKTLQTAEGVMLGTPGYMAPEVIKNEAAGLLVDTYALGIILFELVTGRHPFAGEDAGSMLRAQLSEEAPSLASVRPDVPEELDRLYLACVASAPEDRPHSLNVVARRLQKSASLELASRSGSTVSTAADVTQHSSVRKPVAARRSRPIVKTVHRPSTGPANPAAIANVQPTLSRKLPVVVAGFALSITIAASLDFFATDDGSAIPASIELIAPITVGLRSVERDGLGALRIEATSSEEVRAILEYRRDSQRGRIQAGSDRSKVHRFRLGGISPYESVAVRVVALRPGGVEDPSEWSQVPSSMTLAQSLTQATTDIDLSSWYRQSERALARKASPSEIGKALQKLWIERTPLFHEFRKFQPIGSALMASTDISLADKISTYHSLARLALMNECFAYWRIPFRFPVDICLPDSFSGSGRQRLAGVKEIYKWSKSASPPPDSSGDFGLERLEFPSRRLQRGLRFGQANVRLERASTIKRAELVLAVRREPSMSVFTIEVNRKLTLLFRPPPTVQGTALYHTFDPRVLQNGANLFVIRLRLLSGNAVAESTQVNFLALLVDRE